MSFERLCSISLRTIARVQYFNNNGHAVKTCPFLSWNRVSSQRSKQTKSGEKKSFFLNDESLLSGALEKIKPEVSEANDRLFLFRPTPWKSAAKRSLCVNLLTSFIRPNGSLPQSSTFAGKLLAPSFLSPFEIRSPPAGGEQSSPPDAIPGRIAHDAHQC